MLTFYHYQTVYTKTIHINTSCAKSLSWLSARLVYDFAQWATVPVSWLAVCLAFSQAHDIAQLNGYPQFTSKTSGFVVNCV